MKHLFSIILAIAVVFSCNSQKREYYDPLSWGDNIPEFNVDTSGVFIAVEARGELIGVKERRFRQGVVGNSLELCRRCKLLHGENRSQEH